MFFCVLTETDFHIVAIRYETSGFTLMSLLLHRFDRKLYGSRLLVKSPAANWFINMKPAAIVVADEMFPEGVGPYMEIEEVA